MCVICQLIEKERISSEEAWKAAGGGELTVAPEHAAELIDKIEALQKREIETGVDPYDRDEYTPG
jgi:hypothetical protein